MSKTKKTFARIKVITEDKRLLNKIKKIIQDHLLPENNLVICDKHEYSPLEGPSKNYWLDVTVTKTYQQAIAKSDGGDYGEN